MPNITIEFNQSNTLAATVQLQSNIESREEEALQQCSHCGQMVNELHTVYYGWWNRKRQWCEECRDTDAEQCEHCGRYFADGVRTVHRADGTDEKWCEDCRDAGSVFQCGCCDEFFEGESTEVIVGYDELQEWCGSCVDNEATHCPDCGELVANDELWSLDMWDGSDVCVCPNCRSDHYYTCEECGRRVHVDDVLDDGWHHYCPSCYSPLGDHIYSYHHTDGAWFWQDDMTGVRSWTMTDEDRDRLYLGLELEVAEAVSRKDIADTIYDEFGEKRFVCKKDSTLGRRGVEIVSQPMTPLCHLNSGCWERISEICKNNGALSDMAERSCGLHIHVSRNALKHEDAVYRIDRLMHHFEPQLIKFSRRRNTYWCAIEHDWYVEQCKDAVSRKAEWKSVSSRCKGHNVALNDANSATVEYRLWKGSLNPETIRATIELTTGMTIIADTMSDEMADGLTWTMFKMLVRYALEEAGIPHDDLDAYLERRGL